jgi:Recombination endonuclease VII
MMDDDVRRTEMKRTCLICGEIKPYSEFYYEKRGKFIGARCKICTRAARRKDYHNDPDRFVREANARRRRNPEKIKDTKLKQAYGIPPGTYDKMFKEHNGVCGACGQPEIVLWRGKPTRLCVDHDHLTDIVRGLLCAKCNKALGLLLDSPELILLLHNYIIKFRK